MGSHTIIPPTQEARLGTGEISVQAQFMQKVNEITSQLISQAWRFMPVIPAPQEAIGRRI
jgi:hypothetical protein